MSYSNCGYIVLAFLIEKLSGESYQEFIKSKIFEPLEMKNSGVFENQILVENLAHGYDPGFGEQKLMISPREDLSNSTGAGGIYSTVEDLYKWDRSLYKNIILVDSSIHKMTRNYGDGRGYGFGIYTRFGRKAAGHDGISNGYTAFIDRYYEDDAGVIYAGNIRSGALSIIQNGLSAILFDQEYDNYIPPELDYDFAHKDNDLNKFAGKYELFPGFNLKVIRIREHLFLSGTAGYFTYLHPIGPKSFYYRSMYAKIKFEENENSMVTKMIWMDNKNREYPAIKLK